jgi:hypothetical protein
LRFASSSAIADDDSKWLPNREVTPGAIAEARTAVICVHGYARAHRVWHDKIGTLAKYGIAPDRAPLFEDDDLIPVSRRKVGSQALTSRRASTWLR